MKTYTEEQIAKIRESLVTSRYDVEVCLNLVRNTGRYAAYSQQLIEHDEALAELDKPVVMEPVAWQPIETAPKETGVFIGAFVDGKFKFGKAELFYERANEFEGETFSGWVWSIDDCIESIAENPSHWMPLPAPPQGETK